MYGNMWDAIEVVLHKNGAPTSDLWFIWPPLPGFTHVAMLDKAKFTLFEEQTYKPVAMSVDDILNLGYKVKFGVLKLSDNLRDGLSFALEYPKHNNILFNTSFGRLFDFVRQKIEAHHGDCISKACLDLRGHVFCGPEIREHIRITIPGTNGWGGFWTRNPDATIDDFMEKEVELEVADNDESGGNDRDVTDFHPEEIIIQA